ncbi:SDR family NAD(P)-dependent oxidoreductase [Alkalihalobacterium elongatum]|uniref:SDR family NAD(P)-dependent oxidoreductase n=1 Tax=Alkalihalobacterium elongatum TaxID=2675466 RepID=UPI001C1FDC1B|nr:SDR family NAD(P)-dependent oxidoreductase [Alkalihalobacterium elongatum]
MIFIKGKVVIITGAASGIGRKTAKLFAERNAKLIINDINEENINQLKEELLNEGATVKAICGDVSNSNVVKGIMKTAIDTYGEINILCNNAGVWWPNQDSNVENLEEDVWDKILSINLKSVFLCTKYAIPHMKEGKGGSIINISSMAALRGWINMDAYTASKGGIISLTKSLAAEYGSYGIRVNAICPGSIKTPLTEKIQLKTGYPKNPLGRVGYPEDIGKLILFLASSDSDFITGGVFPVDGGRSIRQ